MPPCCWGCPLLAEVGHRLFHVLVIAAACAVGVALLGVFLVSEIIGACLPGWGE